MVIETEGKKTKAIDVYDEAMEVLPLALTEQRERLLDLIDRIVGAIVEDSCPMDVAPDDWDWPAIFEGYKEHFGGELPEDIADYGDREALAEEMFQRAEKVYLAKEEEIGLELILRVFRHIYLEEIDKSWVDHLTDMEHLRDGIGLRGYGQKD
ncbi:MAG: preprotein translocase subunit SecA, partial [Polyangiaceae bacterium]